MFTIFLTARWIKNLNMSVSIDIILNKGLGYFSYKDEDNLNSMRPTLHLSLEYKEINTLRTF